MTRFQFVPFWHLTRWGFLAQRGVLSPAPACDEFHNTGWYMIAPLVGQFIFYTGTYDTSGPEHLFYQGPNGTEGLIDPDCPVCDEVLYFFNEE